MSSFRVRPRFELASPLSPGELQTLISEKLKHTNAACSGMEVPGHVVLKIPPNERHFWSPQLALNIEPTEQGARVMGLYGPNPSVWVVFMLGYLALGTIGMFVSIIGFAQRALGQDAPVLWALPVLGLAALGLYVFAQAGQKLGAEQTYRLHLFFEDIVGERARIN